MPTLLALDLATRTGWAFGEIPERAVTPIEARTLGAPEVESGAVGFDGEHGQFFRNFERWLTTFLARHRPDVTVFEAPILDRRKSTLAVVRKLHGLAVITEKVADEFAPVFSADLGTVKKHATGNGHAKKEQMIDAARAMGWDPADADEADALWIWDYSCQEWRRGQRSKAAA